MIILPLSDNDPKKWEYMEHTKVKHKILSEYLKTWINVLSGKWQKVCYFDCFAGRGKYEDGNDGSPIIALKAIRDIKQNRTHIKDVACTFRDFLIFPDLTNFKTNIVAEHFSKIY